MLDCEPEQPAFVGRCHSRGCHRNSNALNRDHLPQNARGGVDRGHQDRIQGQRMRRHDLQIAEERVCGCVATGQKYAKPSDNGAEEWKSTARSGEC